MKKKTRYEIILGNISKKIPALVEYLCIYTECRIFPGDKLAWDPVIVMSPATLEMYIKSLKRKTLGH
jgi:hypothetical protein